MDTQKTGRFIALLRREMGLTQRELADSLHISDKTVSKWERGGGLPEVSLMEPLCSRLGVTLNELFCGERLTEASYKENAEATIMNLVKENQENRKKLYLSLIIGCVTIVAVVSLVMLAAFLTLPTGARIAFIAVAVLVAVAGIGAAAVLDREAGTFECPHCHTRFVPTMAAYTKGAHTLTRRRLTCPACGQTSFCRHRITR